MASDAKSTAGELANVVIGSPAHRFWHEYYQSLKMKVLEAATRRAHERDRGRGPGFVEIDDVLCASQQLLPAAVAEIESMQKSTHVHVRTAS